VTISSPEQPPHGPIHVRRHAGPGSRRPKRSAHYSPPAARRWIVVRTGSRVAALSGRGSAPGARSCVASCSLAGRKVRSPILKKPNAISCSHRRIRQTILLARLMRKIYSVEMSSGFPDPLALDEYCLPPVNGLRAFEAAARHLRVKHAAGDLPGAVSQQVRVARANPRHRALSSAAQPSADKGRPDSPGAPATLWRGSPRTARSSTSSRTCRECAAA
jgi:hypothetical protein